VTSSTARAQEIAALYARYASRLQRIVSTKVNAPAQTIEDACQNAWATLLRREDVTLDERGAAWLATAAIHEGWRLTRRGEIPAGAMRSVMREAGDLPEPAADEQALARIEHAERVAELRTLKTRERRDLYLQALGYGYSEIAKATGSSYTAVNRRLSEGRGRLRALERERNAEQGDADKR
jgi:DNA-directed RNA polymerase specialized sigma24 family protein